MCLLLKQRDLNFAVYVYDVFSIRSTAQYTKLMLIPQTYLHYSAVIHAGDSFIDVRDVNRRANSVSIIVGRGVTGQNRGDPTTIRTTVPTWLCSLRGIAVMTVIVLCLYSNRLVKDEKLILIQRN